MKREIWKLGKINKLEQTVLSMQMEIALAWQKQDKALALKLSEKLIRSLEARKLAVYKVISNKGYRTPGFNDKAPRTNEEYKAIVKQLWHITKNPKSYRAKPLRRIYFEKPSGGLRPISIPSYIDRILQALFNFALQPYGEHTADKFSFGFRPLRSPGQAALNIKFLMMAGKYNPFLWVVSLDIKKCYDRINHEWILENVPLTSKHILKEWLKCGYIETEHRNRQFFHETDVGVPQGGIISPLIANIALNGIQSEVQEGVKSELKESVHLNRFADDCVILCHTRKAAEKAIEKTEQFLILRGLELNKEKTKIIDLSQPNSHFKFVGFNFKYYLTAGQWKSYCLVPHEAIKRIKDRLIARMTTAKSLSQLFYDTNAIIMGFYYYYHIVNYRRPIDTFGKWLQQKFGRGLFTLYKKSNFERGKFGLRKGRKGGRFLRKVAYHVIRRRHYLLQKDREKYRFPEQRGLANYVLNKRGTRKVELFNPRHRQIFRPKYKTGLNAYLPDDRIILLQKALTWKAGIRVALLKDQKGLCKCCKWEIISQQSEIHHITPISLGGKFTKKNIALLCTYCHREITNATLTKNEIEIKRFTKLGLLKL